MINITALTLSTAIGIPLGLYVNNLLNKEYRIKNSIKKDMKEILIEKKLKNSKEQYPKVKEIKLFEYGFIINLDIKKVCSLKDIENLQDYINSSFGAIETIISNQYNQVSIEIINNPIKKLFYKPMILGQYNLLLGFDFRGDPIVADMKITPHVLVSGLSGNGKSYMVKTIIKNLNGAEIIILNGFIEDYIDYKVHHITAENEIENYLKSLLEDKVYNENPIYIVLEEMQTFSSNKQITQYIKELLSLGRHYNIFLIGVIQIATKENCKFKDLFNTRCTFKQIDTSAYQVCLGVSVDKDLQKQDFYIYSTNVIRGRTYTISV